MWIYTNNVVLIAIDDLHVMLRTDLIGLRVEDSGLSRLLRIDLPPNANPINDFMAEKKHRHKKSQAHYCNDCRVCDRDK